MPSFYSLIRISTVQWHFTRFAMGKRKLKLYIISRVILYILLPCDPSPHISLAPLPLPLLEQQLSFLYKYM